MLYAAFIDILAVCHKANIRHNQCDWHEAGRHWAKNKRLKLGGASRFSSINNTWSWFCCKIVVIAKAPLNHTLDATTIKLWGPFEYYIITSAISWVYETEVQLQCNQYLGEAHNALTYMYVLDADSTFTNSVTDTLLPDSDLILAAL